MAIEKGYATAAEVKAALDISDSNDDTKIEGVVEAVSRAIDLYTARFFWVDGTVAIRYYTSEYGDRVYTDDISTTTGLIVQTDEDGDGTFENTWAATDYNLLPYNAGVDSWPYNGLETSYGGTYAFPAIKRGVKITAKFGWSAVPKTINTACIIQSERLFKRFDAPLGVQGTNALGSTTVKMPELDEDVKALLLPYRRMV